MAVRIWRLGLVPRNEPRLLSVLGPISIRLHPMESADVSCPDWLSRTRSIAEATRHLDAELHESNRGGASGTRWGHVTASSADIVNQLWVILMPSRGLKI